MKHFSLIKAIAATFGVSFLTFQPMQAESTYRLVTNNDMIIDRCVYLLVAEDLNIAAANEMNSPSGIKTTAITRSGNGIISLDMGCADIAAQSAPSQKQRDNSTCKTLGHEWVWLRNPVTGNYSYGKGSLKLKGTSAGPDSTTESPTMLLRRQEHINFTATTAVSLENPSAGSEAGLTVFASEPSHYDMFVTQKTDGSKTVALRYRLNELTHIEKELSLPHDCKKAILRVTASPDCL